MKFDDILVKLGGFGKYQKIQYFLLCLPSITCAVHMMMAVFITANPDHRCKIVPNDTYAIQNPYHKSLVELAIPKKKDGTLESCQMYRVNLTLHNVNNTSNDTLTEGCPMGWVYDKTYFDNTLVTDLNLVCNTKSLRSTAQVIFMGGVLVGALSFGILSDNIGRKKTLMITVAMQGVFGVVVGLSVHYLMFAVFRFLIGFSTAGVFLNIFVLGMEWVSPKYRMHTGIIVEYFFAIGVCALSGIAYLIPQWKWLQIACSIPSFCFLSYWWLVPESPRWLISKGRFAEAELILNKVANVNGVTMPAKILSCIEEEKEESPSTCQLLGLLKRAPTLLLRSLVIFFNWLVVSMVYYGLSLNSGNLGVNIYISFLISGAVEFVAYTSCFLIDTVGRKGPHCISMVLGGLACISTIFSGMYISDANTRNWVNVGLSNVGKYGATVGFCLVFIWSAEIFPTLTRTSQMGMSSMFARVGGMIAPVIADLGDLVPGDFGKSLPLIVFGVASVAAGLLSLVLPETNGRKLPETIEDAENFTKTKPSGTSSENIMLKRTSRGDEDNELVNNENKVC